MIMLLMMAMVRSTGQGWGKKEAAKGGGASALAMADE
jgi:hypothetical protein